MQPLYFAYGSNMAAKRIRERVDGAEARCRAYLDGWRLVMDKPGRDGSAKVNIVLEPGAGVWGALWELAEAQLLRLDRHERGYARVAVTVFAETGPLAATTYASALRGAAEALAPGYKELIVAGAREHGLPPEWLAWLEALPAG
jgi:gamma-glutamylcyclotransferase